MAKKGLSKPVMAQYIPTYGPVYRYGIVFSHAVEYSIDAEYSDDNPLFGDNGVAEDDLPRFTKGTLTLNVTDIPNANTGFLFDVTSGWVDITYQEGDRQYIARVYDKWFSADAIGRSFGFGIIELHQVDETDKYRTIILPKVTLRTPGESATTKGETLDWQTSELTFDVERSDLGDHPWKIEAWHDSEAEALAYLKTKLNVS